MPPRYRRHWQGRPPRGHWLLVGLVLQLFAFSLLVEGYTHDVLGETSPPVAQAPSGGAAAPGTVVNGGPVINATGARPQTYSMPLRTVALTFDDGPDPS